MLTLSSHQCHQDDQPSVRLIPLLALIAFSAWLFNVRRVAPRNLDHEHRLSAASALVSRLIDTSEAEAARISARSRSNSRRASSAHRAGSRGRPRAALSEDEQLLEVPQAIAPASASSAGNELIPNGPEKDEGLLPKPTSVDSDPGQPVSVIARPLGTTGDYAKAKDRHAKTVCIAAPWWATFHIAHCVPLAPSP